jgi:hypothetical protein
MFYVDYLGGATAAGHNIVEPAGLCLHCASQAVGTGVPLLYTGCRGGGPGRGGLGGRWGGRGAGWLCVFRHPEAWAPPLGGRGVEVGAGGTGPIFKKVPLLVQHRIDRFLIH